MAAAARIGRSVARRLSAGASPPTYGRRAATAAAAKAEDNERCSGFLPWLRSKAGTSISSVLSVGASPHGRSLFASRPIQKGDCIMEVPHSVQLTEDKLTEEVRRLLDDGVAGDTTKIAVLLMMEKHLGHDSGWAPYVRSLPCKDQMHNMVFWDLNELHMVTNSSIFYEAIIQKEHGRKQFSAVKPTLERFPHLFGEIKLEDFMHAAALVSSRAWQTSRGVSLVPFADFLNHDSTSDSILIYDEQKDVSEVIADRNYSVGEQVRIRYGKYSNATLALNFGFTLSRNIYDQAHICIDMPEQDPLYKKKLDIWQKHRTPKSERMCSSGCTKTSFAIKEVKYSGDKGTGIPQILRAFVRVFYSTSTEELEEMAMETAENDGRLARHPLKHLEREIHAHRMLLFHLDNMIQGHSTAIKQLEIVDAASRSMLPFRKEMAKDILAGELQKVDYGPDVPFEHMQWRMGGRGREGRMLQRAASNAYSWWWASHIRTKQSKWLDNHLQDMEHRVKCMLLLLGEEADSFSKRAEMYYKRRPEVITQVEEVYRAYRGLADRYDIMSGELHKANHTIATAFPDQVQYAMLQEEDDNVPKAFTPVDPRKIHKSTVDGLLKKKKGEGPGAKGEKDGPAPINKENAREEISRLQKAILVMQTEKEFIKNSYESGIAKYWDLEKEINEMQEKACQFQDKFEENVVIEDDEARALMTATALKSCEDTIVRLQELRKTSASQALDESERVKVLREKLKPILDENGKSLPDLAEKNIRKNHITEMGDVYHVKLGELEMQTIVDKIKEHFERDCSISMEDITEQIDDLVNTVVDLELMVSSQTSQVERMRRENDELESCVKTLEEEKGSAELEEKLKQVEEELIKVHALEGSFHKDESTIRSNFTEAISRFSDFADMLQAPVCEHGSAAHTVAATDEEALPLEPSSKSRGDDIKEEEKMTDNSGAPPQAPEPQQGTITEPAASGAAVPKTEVDVPKTEPKTEEVHVPKTEEVHVPKTEPKTEEAHVPKTEPKTEEAHVPKTEPKTEEVHVPKTEPKTEEVHVPKTEPKTEEVHVPKTEPKTEEVHVPKTEEVVVPKTEPKVHVPKSEEVAASVDGAKSSDNNNGNDKSLRPGSLARLRHISTPGESEEQEEKMKQEGSVSGDMRKLQERLMDGLDDKEKVLLSEYTSLLEDYKDTKRKLIDVEKKNQDCLNEIRALRELIGDKERNCTVVDRGSRGHRRTPNYGNQRRQSLSNISRLIRMGSSVQEGNSDDGASSDAGSEDTRLPSIAEVEKPSPLEDKFRRDIDTLLEENLELWMKFSSSLQRVQEFQSRYEDLQQQAKADGGDGQKKLRALKTELQVWSEQNAMLRGELQCRFTSLCDIQEEISTALDMDTDEAEEAEEGAPRFTSYSAGKFQGEVLNMQQENNRVSDELQSGLDHVKTLQSEIERKLSEGINLSSSSAAEGEGEPTEGEGGSSAMVLAHVPCAKAKVPLQSFLFPTKPKKQTLFQRVTPAMLHKQQVDMRFLARLPR